MLGKVNRLATKARSTKSRPRRSASRSRRGREFFLAFEPLEPRVVLDAGPLVISEIMAANSSTLVDENGDTSDWIEIHNPTELTLNLDGWYLTDDPDDLTKWEFPAYALAPDAYLLVFASGKDRTNPTAKLHTNFQLDSQGEYLALVKPDGTTVAYEFAPAFPEQFTDISYGYASGTGSHIPDGDELTYLVPGVEEAALGTGWTDAEFHDSAWDAYTVTSNVLITEIGTVSPDFIEIQNVDKQAVDTSGWVVALNHGLGAPVNQVHPILWELPDSISPGQILHRDDAAWGADIVWASSGPNWAMIVDDDGNVVDFVAWRYTAEELATLDVTINGHRITLGDAWSGSAFPLSGVRRGSSLQRQGNSDGNTAADWAVAPDTMGQQNVELATSFFVDVSTGMGFDANSSGLADALQVNVEDAMHGVNASFWARIPFEVSDPQAADSLRLRIKYNDGFVAYLNGQRIASRNAPDSLAWNSAATATRSAAESLEFEQIDISDSLVWLRPGRNVLAIHGLNASAADPNFLIAAEVVLDGNRYFSDPTPGKTNSTGFTQFVADTEFSVDRGFYDQPFSVEITTDTPDATIYYTLDGSEPTDTHGATYTGPLTIDTTTVLRAAAYKPGFHPSDVDTQTYIFLDDVIHQTGAGLPTTWGRYVYGGSAGSLRPANYEMDPQVVNDPRYRNTIKDDLRSIPTMSLVLDPDDLWDETTGIYANSLSEGVAWERAASVELIGTDGSTQFQVDAGVRIHGGWGRRLSQNSKHSFRLLFKGEYGPTKLRYPLFGDQAADEFDTLVLRAGFNDSWRNSSSNATYLQDRWAAETQLAMGGYAPHGTWVHLYVNGLYWGLYNPVERPNAAFAASYLGGEKEDYDAYRTNGLIDGNAGAWNQLQYLINSPASNYTAIKNMLDTPAFIDYLMVNHFGANWDWPHNNWYASRRRDPPGQWYFHSWDAEGCLMRGVSDNNVSDFRGSAAGRIYEQLRTVEEFRMAFADRIHRHMFNGGALTPESNIARIDAMAGQIDRAIVGESARWGDGRLDNNSPRTRDSHWLPRINYLRTSYLPQRTGIVLNQYRSVGLYPDTVAPTFNQHGGSVDAGFQLTMTAPDGTIYFTTDGSDPRLPGGNISPTARVFDSAATQRLIDIDDRWAYNQSGDDLAAAWRRPDYDDASWQNGKGLLYVESSALPAPKNTPLTLGSTTYYFRKHFDFQGNPQEVGLQLNMVLDDGAVVYLNDREVFRLRMAGEIGDPVASTDFASPGVGNAVYEGPFAIPTDALVQGDNVIAVEVHQRSADSSDVVFGLELDVVPSVRIDNPTLVKSRALHNGEWSALNEAQFYVGAQAAADNLAITEINYNPPDPTPAELAAQPATDEDFTAGDFEFIELLNTTDDQVVDLTGVEFTEGITFAFNDGAAATLAPGERVVVVANTDAFAARYGGGIHVAGTFTGKLDNNGEQIRLADYQGQTILDFTYNDAGRWPGRADGKGAALELVDQENTDPAAYGQPESWRSSSRYGGTPGDVPAADPGVVITEVLTHTDAPQADAIELHNTTSSAVDIGGWYLSDQWGWESNPQNGDYKKFRIPDGTTIPAGGYLAFYEGHYDQHGVLQFGAYEFGGPGPKDFALNGAEGDDVWLMEADASGKLRRFADHVEFGAAANGESFGRWPGVDDPMVPMAELTLGGENTGPRVGPVVISEIMYNPDPAGGGEEFVELYNASRGTVRFYDPAHPTNTWRISGLGFSFPGDVELPPGGVMLVVPGDPAAFRAQYGVPAEVQIFGPYEGALDNGGEKLRLLRPDEPTADDPPVIPWLLVDEVDYAPEGPWPSEADGSGDSLHREQSDAWGNAAASWSARTPTPGSVPWTVPAAVVGRHVFYNHSAFDGSDASANAADDSAIAPNVQALFPDEKATPANYTSYSRGINGIMVDIAGLADAAGLSLATISQYFRFQVGNSDDLSRWTPAPTPTAVTVRPGAGDEGSDRVTITWTDGAIRNQWLEVTVLSERTGLPGDDVFYFGNAVAESGDSAAHAQVTIVDLLLARNNPRSFLDPSGIDFAYDYNRDARVNSTDVLLARNNQTSFLTALQLIHPPEPAASQPTPRLSLVPRVPSAAWSWLYEFDSSEGHRQSFDERTAPERAIDRLLATYWA